MAPLSSVTLPLSWAVESCAETIVLARRRPIVPRQNSLSRRSITSSYRGTGSASRNPAYVRSRDVDRRCVGRVPPKADPPNWWARTLALGYLGTDASGPPATNSSRPSLSLLIVTREPLVSTTLPPYVVNVTLSPAWRSFGPQP